MTSCNFNLEHFSPPHPNVLDCSYKILSPPLTAWRHLWTTPNLIKNLHLGLNGLRGLHAVAAVTEVWRYESVTASHLTSKQNPATTTWRHRWTWRQRVESTKLFPIANSKFVIFNLARLLHNLERSRIFGRSNVSNTMTFHIRFVHFSQSAVFLNLLFLAANRAL